MSIIIQDIKKDNNCNLSVTYFNAFSTIAGINRAKYGLDNSKHGFVFTSMSHTFISSSIMKSYPNISNEDVFLLESNFLETARIVS